MPRKILIQSDTQLIAPPNKLALNNVNNPEEFKQAFRYLKQQQPAGSAEKPTRVKTIHLQYYALLRETRGLSKETIKTSAPTAAALYAELKTRHGFQLAIETVKLAVNNEFQPWTTILNSGDEVVFVPPVAGG